MFIVSCFWFSYTFFLLLFFFKKNKQNSPKKKKKVLAPYPQKNAEASTAGCVVCRTELISSSRLSTIGGRGKLYSCRKCLIALHVKCVDHLQANCNLDMTHNWKYSGYNKTEEPEIRCSICTRQLQDIDSVGKRDHQNKNRQSNLLFFFTKFLILRFRFCFCC